MKTFERIEKDEKVLLFKKDGKKANHSFRLVQARKKDTDELLFFLTNEMDLAVAIDLFGDHPCPTWKNEDLHLLFECYSHLNNLPIENNVECALDLYVNLLEYLHRDGLMF